MVKMSTSGHASDESEDAFTSSESSADESSDNEPDDSSDSASVKSLAFSFRPRRSKVTVKSKKSNKRVRFKPGDSLVLIYIIPNREMLGLKSESEDSDEYEGSDDDSGDDDDSDDGDDDDDTEDNDDDDNNDDDDDGVSGKTKSIAKKAKPFAKLIAVKQVNKRKNTDIRNANKDVQEKPKEINTVSQTKVKKTPRVRPKREKKEPVKTNRNKEFFSDNKNKSKPKQYKTNNAIKVDKRPRNRRNRSRLLEIRATVESTNKSDNTHVTPKLTLKSDVKPSIIDVNSSVSTKQLTNRTRLQPTSFRISKPGSRPSSAGVSRSVSSPLPEKPVSSAKVVSSNYSSLTSVLPDSYVNFRSFQNNNTVEESIKRLDPDNMNSSGKRNYAWQIANGTITSQSLRTPSILPFWDSLQNSVTENNTIKLPT